MYADRLLLGETLIAVLDTGSFTAAAGRLRVSQSTVSRRIAALERRLGDKPLLTRNAKWIAPTEAAEAYVRDVRLILAQLDAADAAAHDARGEPAGLIRLSLPPALSRAKLLQPLADLQKRYPRLRLNLDLSESYVDLRDGAFDLLVRIKPLEQTGVEQVKLAVSPVICCASRSYVAAHGAPRTIADLCAHAIIGVSWRDSAATLATDSGLKAMIRKASPAIVTNDVGAAHELVRRGYGVGAMPRYLVEDDLESGRLIHCLTDLIVEPLGVYALFPRSIRDSPRVRAVLEALTTALT